MAPTIKLSIYVSCRQSGTDGTKMKLVPMLGIHADSAPLFIKQRHMAAFLLPTLSSMELRERFSSTRSAWDARRAELAELNPGKTLSSTVCIYAGPDDTRPNEVRLTD
jgi:hypothetical protein